MKVYQILVKRTDYYTVITIQAKTEAEALTLAQNEGEVISVLDNVDINSTVDINYNEQMLNYYPEVIKAIREFQAMMKTEGEEIDKMHQKLIQLLSDAYVSTASETRISQWEQFLGITPMEQGDDSLETWLSDRRETILARMYSPSKLSTKSIAEIVSIFTGGAAVSYFKDSTIYVLISPPKNNKQYKFENVEQELRKKIPAHLNFKVDRNYYTWLQMKESNPTWDDLKTKFKTWEEVLLYVPTWN